MKTYNWGIIGTGGIAKKMAEAMPFISQSKLYAVSSRTIEKANTFAEKYNCKAYGSYEDLANDPNVDIVYIATPHNLHCKNTLMCINKGKHVLCEKPFAVNGSEVRKMIDAAKGKNIFLMEALWTRFIPHVLKAKEIIDSGQLGKINLLKADFGINVPYNPNHRLYNKELIGGSLLDLGIYPLFMALLMLGKPTSIKATAGIGNTKIDTNCSFTLGYENDTLAVLYSSILASTDNTAVIYCEKGTIQFDRHFHAPGQIRIIRNGEIENIPIDLIGNGYNYEANEVIQCLEKNKTQSCLMSWDDSLLLIDTLDAIRKQIGLVYEGHDV